MVNGVTAYYENAGFSTRISRRYRSAFRDDWQHWATASSSHIEAEAQVDFQVGYNFKAGDRKGLSLLLQVNNLTERAVRPATIGNGNGAAAVEVQHLRPPVPAGPPYKF